MKTKPVHRMVSAVPPPSGREPRLSISPRHVRDLTNELKEFHSIFSPLFQRQEQRHWSLLYMQGQMLDIERKSIEPMARALEGGDEQAMQQHISASPWKDEPIIRRHQKEVIKTLGRRDGVVILDGMDTPKQGKHSVGAARQHCGALGKCANCQAAVVMVYASEAGHALLDRRLYLPEKWFEPEYAELRKECGVPEDLTFKTKNEYGGEILEPLLDDESVPFKWVLMDEAFGKDTKLLNRIRRKKKHYFAEIPRSTRVWRRRPKVITSHTRSKDGQPRTKTELAPDTPASLRADEVAQKLPPHCWQKVIIHEGTKGPQQVEIACLRCVFSEDALPGREEWLILRRKSAQQALKEWKFYRSDAPKKTCWKKLARRTAWRWPVETTIEECKSELGMDHYEVRNWLGWHHHMTLTMLSHHFLVRMRAKLEEQAPALTVQQMRRILQVILPKRVFDDESILIEIQRIQQRNYDAYCSHRKRQRRKKASPT